MFDVFFSWLFWISGHATRNCSFDKSLFFSNLIIQAVVGSFMMKLFFNMDTLSHFILFLSVAVSELSNVTALITANFDGITFTSLNSETDGRLNIRSDCLLLCIWLYYIVVIFLRPIFSFLLTKLIINVQIVLLSLSLHFGLIPVIQHILLVHRLLCRFSSLNTRLAVVFAHHRLCPTGNLRNKLSAIFKEHRDLHNTVVRVNSYFTPFYIFNVASRTSFLILRIYFELLTIHNVNDGNNQNVTSLQFVAMQMVVLMTVSILCHLCAQQANRTVLIALQNMKLATPDHAKSCVEEFALSCFDNPIQFSVAGVFNFNNSLILKVAAFSLTYLTIALQIKPT